MNFLHISEMFFGQSFICVKKLLQIAQVKNAKMFTKSWFSN